MLDDLNQRMSTLIVIFCETADSPKPLFTLPQTQPPAKQ